jgi:hypothetical protein
MGKADVDDWCAMSRSSSLKGPGFPRIKYGAGLSSPE